MYRLLVELTLVWELRLCLQLPGGPPRMTAVDAMAGSVVPSPYLQYFPCHLQVHHQEVLPVQERR